MAKEFKEKPQAEEKNEVFGLPELLKWMGEDWAKDPRLAPLMEEKYQPYFKYGELQSL